ncbi:hypothetical protein M0812_17299 [Anaeramoeba flamelloides]|uniref:PH domain-containing protein n=1 Tax=Anaeramoeba flamelloides TaxID=1746091 RepID=A0AAV7ZBZ0_9EUKA|nr:hypothetical protein M0812_17299 [Anaeramoeba flamelloides]
MIETENQIYLEEEDPNERKKRATEAIYEQLKSKCHKGCMFETFGKGNKLMFKFLKLNKEGTEIHISPTSETPKEATIVISNCKNVVSGKLMGSYKGKKLETEKIRHSIYVEEKTGNVDHFFIAKNHKKQVVWHDFLRGKLNKPFTEESTIQQIEQFNDILSQISEITNFRKNMNEIPEDPYHFDFVYKKIN